MTSNNISHPEIIPSPELILVKQENETEIFETSEEGCSSSLKFVDYNIYEDAENEDVGQESFNPLPKEMPDSSGLLPSETIRTEKSSTTGYKSVEASSYIKHDNNRCVIPLAMCLSNNETSEDTSSLSCVECILGGTDIKSEDTNILGTFESEVNNINRASNEEESIQQTKLCYSNSSSCELRGKLLAIERQSGKESNETSSESQERNTQPGVKGKAKNQMKSSCNEEKYECHLCEKIFSDYPRWRRHTRNHAAEKIFRCKKCGYKCAIKHALKIHLRTHSRKKPFSCKICGSKFSIENYLKQHIKTHTGIKPFKCNLCGYKCSAKGSLKIHMRTHTGEKPYECETCGFKCTIGGTLKNHMRIHTMEKPFQCKICTYVCSQDRQLKMHILRTHPLTCEQCGIRFTQIAYLKEHERIHTG